MISSVSTSEPWQLAGKKYVKAHRRERGYAPVLVPEQLLRLTRSREQRVSAAALNCGDRTETTRGLLILVASLTSGEQRTIL